MRKKTLALLLALACLCAGCGDSILGVRERAPISGESAVPVPPAGADVHSGSMPVTLYYQYKNEPYLVAQPATIPLVSEMPVERALLERLIQGPDSERYDVTALITPQTAVVDITQRGEMLEITLSREFFRAVEDMQATQGYSAEQAQQELMLRRRLAVYSIVNTLTELGGYSRVSVLIQGESGALPEKLTRSMAGFSGMPGQAMDPLARDTSLILTPDNTAAIVLEALKVKDWARLYSFIAVRDLDASEVPALEDVRSMLSSRASLMEYEVKMGQTVSSGGGQVTLCVRATFVDALGNAKEYDDLPLRLIRQNEVWMVAFPSLAALVPVT